MSNMQLLPPVIIVVKGGAFAPRNMQFIRPVLVVMGWPLASDMQFILSVIVVKGGTLASNVLAILLEKMRLRPLPTVATTWVTSTRRARCGSARLESRTIWIQPRPPRVARRVVPDPYGVRLIHAGPLTIWGAAHDPLKEEAEELALNKTRCDKELRESDAKKTASTPIKCEPNQYLKSDSCHIENAGDVKTDLLRGVDKKVKSNINMKSTTTHDKEPIWCRPSNLDGAGQLT